MKSVSLKSVLEYTVAVCLALECDSIWKWTNGSGYFKYGIYFLFTVSMLGLLAIQKLKINRKNQVVVVAVLSYLLVFLVINYNAVRDTFQFVSVLLLFFVYASFTPSNNMLSIIKKYSSFIVFLACLSLIFFIFGSLLHIIHTNTSVIVWVNNMPREVESYWYLHYERQFDDTFGLNTFRNTGIFVEAPKYSLNLSIALLYELLGSKRVGNKLSARAWILIITIITTFTTTGITFVLAVLVFKILLSESKSRIVHFMKYLTLLCMVFAAIGAINYLFHLKAATDSYDSRIDDYTAGLKAWLKYPLFGSGYMNMQVIHKYMSTFRSKNVGFSNSLFRVLAQGGIYLLILYLLPALKIIIKGIKEKQINLIIFSAAFIYLFVSTSFPYNYITGCILACFWVNAFKKKYEYSGDLNSKGRMRCKLAENEVS